MAVTWTTTIIHRSVFGNKRVVTADIEATGTSTVTATGDAYTPSELGLTGFDIVTSVLTLFSDLKRISRTILTCCDRPPVW